jgi:hypothetical protein
VNRTFPAVSHLAIVFVPALYAAWFRIRRDSPAQGPVAVPLTAAA